MERDILIAVLVINNFLRSVFLRGESEYIIQAVHDEAFSCIGRPQYKIQTRFEINDGVFVPSTGHDQFFNIKSIHVRPPLVIEQ